MIISYTYGSSIYTYIFIWSKFFLFEYAVCVKNISKQKLQIYAVCRVAVHKVKRVYDQF